MCYNTRYLRQASVQPSLGFSIIAHIRDPRQVFGVDADVDLIPKIKRLPLKTRLFKAYG